MSYYDNSLSTAHTKMDGPTFVNEKVVHILEKKNIIVLNFEQKIDGDYYYEHLT